MSKYRVVFKRPAPSPNRPDAVRAFIDVETDQSDIGSALAWAYRQYFNTKDPVLRAQVVSVNVRAVQGGSDA